MVSGRAGKFTLFVWPQLPQRLSDQREIGDFAEGNIAIDFQGLLPLVDHHAQPFFTDAWILVINLDHAVVGGLS